MLEKIKKFLLHHELLIVIMCAVAILRLPSLLEPYWYGDEGIYLTLGNGLRHGLTFYRDIHDNKPPLLYVIAALAGSVFWFRLILLVWNTASIGVFAWIATRLLNPKHLTPSVRLGAHTFPIPTLSTLATLLFALLPFAAEGNIANGEIFMILPTLAGFAFLLKAREQSKAPLRSKLILSIAAGISLSLAFLTKVPAAFDAVAAGIFFFLIPSTVVTQPGKRIRTFLRSLISLPAWAYAIAFLIPIALSIAYYTAMGAGQPYIKAALLQNVNYLSSWKTGSHETQELGQTGLKNRALIVGALTLILLLASPLLTWEVLLIVLWFAYSLFGALLSERPYPHYLIQVIPPLALIIALFIQTLFDLRTRLPQKTEYLRSISSALLLSGCVGVLIYSFVVIKFWNYAIPPYYQNYIKFVTGKITRDQYFSFFDTSLPEQYKIAEIIAANTDRNDSIFIWGDLPCIYASTRRLPPGRYTSAYHIKDFGGFDETLVAIYKKEPKYVLIDNRIEMFPSLQPLLFEEYAQVYVSPSFTLYRRLNNSEQ